MTGEKIQQKLNNISICRNRSRSYIINIIIINNLNIVLEKKEIEKNIDYQTKTK